LNSVKKPHPTATASKTARKKKTADKKASEDEPLDENKDAWNSLSASANVAFYRLPPS
jgi:hypothetical protein